MEKIFYTRGRDLSADSYTCNNFVNLIDDRIKRFPEVPLFASIDYASNVRTDLMPADFRDQYQGISTFLFETYGPGLHAAVMGDNSFSWVLLLQSIICAHGVTVALDKALEKEKLEEMLGFSDASVLFYGAKYAEKAKSLGEKLGLTLYAIEDCQSLAAEGRKMMEAGKTGCFDLAPDPDVPAIFMFTSGTTGDSKCVMLSQKNVLSDGAVILDYLGCQNINVTLMLPLHHAYALNGCLLPYIMGGRTVLFNRDLKEMFRDLAAFEPHRIVAVPIFVELCYRMLWKTIRDQGLEDKVQEMIRENRANSSLTFEEKRDMFQFVTKGIFGSNLSGFHVGGAPVDPKYHEGFRDFGISVLQGYGITECSPIISINTVDWNKPETVGRPMPEIEIKIDNPNDRGEGEICVRAATVMPGYYKNEEATREALRDGWFHTGDIGFLDEDGFIYLNGRIKNLIILSNGENVSPEELEIRLCRHPAIQEAVVYEKRRMIAAQLYLSPEYAAAHPGEDLKGEARAFIEELNGKTASYKQITLVEFRDVPFDKNSSNKIIRSSVI